MPESHPSSGRSRLEPSSDEPAFAPWARAGALTDCELYWLPVSTFPIGHLQRRWLLRFLQLLAASVAAKREMLPEVFLEMKVIQPDYRQEFLKSSREFLPILGLGRHPGKPLPATPDAQYAEDLQKGRVTYDPASLKPAFAYWFLRRKMEEQLHLFFGSSGTVILFLKPEEPPKKIPKPNLALIRDPALRQMVEETDLDAQAAEMKAMQAPFLQQSKDIFAADLEDRPEFDGYRFVAPLLNASDFFTATCDELQKWFELFGVYVRESPEDKGILLASKEPIQEDLSSIMQILNKEATYPHQ